jgi:hypothetical protein
VAQIVGRNIAEPAPAPKSNPSELAAAGGSDPKPPSRNWSDEDQQVARHIFGRLQAPSSLLDGKATPDEIRGWALGLSKMQAGIDAKTDRLESKIREFEAMRSAPSKGEDPGTDPLLEVKSLAEAIEDGDSKKVGTALEKLVAALRQPAQQKALSPKVSAEVEDALLESARMRLEAEWPGLRNSTIAAEVIDYMSGLKGSRYEGLRPADARLQKMRDAATVIIGPAGAASNQTQTRIPQSHTAPVPNGRVEPQSDSDSSDPLAVARQTLSKHGF